MRYLTTLASCIFLSALIFVYTPTLAQTTRSIGGMVVSDTKTDAGTLTVKIPDDIRPGDHITGQVITTPEGKNDKEKKKNSDKLMALTLAVPGTTLLLKEVLKDKDKNNFEFTVPKDGGNTALNLLENNHNIGTITVPQTPELLTTDIPHPSISLQTPLIEKNDPYLTMHSPNANLNNYEFLIKDKTGAQQMVAPVAVSPREAIVEIPANMSIGSATLIARPKGSTNPNDEVRMNYTEVQADYSIGKEKLQKGETTLLSGTISGLDPKVIHDPTLVLANTTGNIITLEKGNDQLIHIAAKEGRFTFTRTITGVTPGSFNINATLNANPKDYNDQFILIMRDIRTASEFNEWLEALKYDLVKYAQTTEIINQKNAQTILNNLHPLTNTDDLEAAKTRTANMLRTLNVDPQKLMDWDAAYVGENYALNHLGDEITHHTTRPTDYDLIDHFTENIQHRAEKAGYKRSLGPMVNTLLMMELVNHLFNNQKDYDKASRDLYNQVSGASTALPDEYRPRYKRPDPDNDLVGYLDPAKNTLWTTKETLPYVINSLHATKSTTGKYNFTGVNLYGQSVPCSFTVVTASFSQIHAMAKIFADIILNGAAAANNNKDSTRSKDSTGKKDSTKPRFTGAYRIKQDTDKTSGSVYRFYKNAECVPLSDYANSGMGYDEPGTTDCEAETAKRWEWGWSEQRAIDSAKANGDFDWEKHRESYKTGRFCKTTTKPTFKCGKGSSYCTEVLTVVQTISYYDDDKCSVLVDTQVTGMGRRFSCSQK